MSCWLSGRPSLGLFFIQKYVCVLNTVMVQRELTTLRIFCKYIHIHQAKGEIGASPGTHPTIETNKHEIYARKAIFLAHFAPKGSKCRYCCCSCRVVQYRKSMAEQVSDSIVPANCFLLSIQWTHVQLVPKGTLQIWIRFMRQWSDPTLE